MSAVPESTQEAVPYMIQTKREREESLCAVGNPVSLMKISELIDSMGLGKGAVVLNMGCGCGGVTPQLAKKYPEIQFVGTDMSEEQLEVARTKTGDLKNLCWVKSDVYDMKSLREEHPEGFDVVLSRFMLMHVPDFSTALKNLVAVKKEGGALCLGEPREGFGLRASKLDGSEADADVQKLVDAWGAMVGTQAKLQKAHRDVADMAEKLLKDELKLDCDMSTFELTMNTPKKRRMLVLGAEMAQQVLPSMPEPVQKIFAQAMDYDLASFAKDMARVTADTEHAFYTKNFGILIAR